MRSSLRFVLSFLQIPLHQSLVCFSAWMGQAGRGCGVGDDLTLDAVLHPPDLYAVQLPGPNQLMQALGIHTDAPGRLLGGESVRQRSPQQKQVVLEVLAVDDRPLPCWSPFRYTPVVEAACQFREEVRLCLHAPLEGNGIFVGAVCRTVACFVRWVCPFQYSTRRWSSAFSAFSRV